MLNVLRRFIGATDQYVGTSPPVMDNVERRLALLSDKDVLDAARRALYDTGKGIDDYARDTTERDSLMEALSNAQIIVLSLEHLARR